MSAIEELLDAIDGTPSTLCCHVAHLESKVAAVRDELAAQKRLWGHEATREEATKPRSHGATEPPDYGEPFSAANGNLHDRWGAYPRSEAVKAIALRANHCRVRNPKAVANLIADFRADSFKVCDSGYRPCYPYDVVQWCDEFDKEPSGES